MSLPEVMLTILCKEDITGYDITKKFSENTGFFWTASHQQVYRELRKLEAQKLVSHKLKPQSGKPDKKIYSITQLGKNRLAEWVEEPLLEIPIRDPYCAKLIAHGSMPSRQFSESLNKMLKRKTERRVKLQITMDKYYSDLDILTPTARLTRLTIRRNILELDSWITWAKEAIKEIS